MSFQNLKLGVKQGLGFGIILIIMACGHAYVTNVLRTLRVEIDEVSSNRMPRAIAISDLNLHTTNLRIHQLQHAYSPDASAREEKEEAIINLITKINDDRDTYEKLKKDSERQNLYSSEEGELYQEFDRKWDAYQESSIAFFRLVRSNQMEEALVLLDGEAREIFTSLSQDLVGLVAINKADAFAAAGRAGVTYSTTHRNMIILFIVTILLSGMIAMTLVRFVTRPVHQLAMAASRVAEGDLDVKLDIPGKNEIGDLAQSFNQMTASLRAANLKTQSQAEKLQKQHNDLQSANKDLEAQKSEIEQKNRELEKTLQQLKDTQDQLILKEKMASLGNLVAGVAHEVNTPIGAVHSAADVTRRCLDKMKLVLESSKTMDDAARNENYKKSFNILADNNRVTMEASDRITRIVKSLKTFARLDEAEYLKANIHEGLDSTLTLINHEIKNRVAVDKNYGNIPDINCFPNQLNQVFMNILVNAAQAIKDTGHISIKTEYHDDRIMIRIADDGIGISKQNLKKIFNPGFTTKGVGVGTGLGLSLSYSILQKHNGDILVESEPGKGSVFTITLPTNLNTTGT